MINKVEHFINENNLLGDLDGLVVGVSGGADSICLLHILQQLQPKYDYELIAVHIHHGLRGQQADADVQFVSNYCKEKDIPLAVHYEDVKEQAVTLKVSEEEAGRIIRYQHFNEALESFNKGAIAVAHHQDDQVETVLHNFIRGTGLKGLGGIQPKRDKIIRPLLCVTRQEIEKYLENNELSYQIDETNGLDIYTRNKIRLSLIPFIEKEFNSNFVSSVNHTALLLQEEENYMNNVAKDAYEKVVVQQKDKSTIDLALLLSYPMAIRRRIIRKGLEYMAKGLKDISFSHVEDVLILCEKDTGKTLNLPKGITAYKSYNTLILSKEHVIQQDFNYVVDHFPADILIKELQLEIHIKIIDVHEYYEKNNYTKCFDYDKIKYVLSFRNRQSGDYIHFKGMKGNKKLKNYFIDEKIPQIKRDKILLLADGNEIIWIYGNRINENYKVSKDSKRILLISVKE